MNDWQNLVIIELKALNRKIERIFDKMEEDNDKFDDKLYELESKIESKFDREVDPIKIDVARAKVLLPLIALLASAVSGIVVAFFANVINISS